MKKETKISRIVKLHRLQQSRHLKSDAPQSWYCLNLYDYHQMDIIISCFKVDAECQTERPEIMEEQEDVEPSLPVCRSKGDGGNVDSSVLLRLQPLTISSSSSSCSISSSSSEIESEEETYEWDRKRGRASGSSQRLSLCETSSQNLAIKDQLLGNLANTPGRRYTVDMSQYRYSDSLAKRAQLVPSSPTPSSTVSVQQHPSSSEKGSICCLAFYNEYIFSKRGIIYYSEHFACADGSFGIVLSVLQLGNL